MDSVKLMKEVDFEVSRLADMMGAMDRVEPYLRRADLVTLSCDAVESFSAPFSAPGESRVLRSAPPRSLSAPYLSL